MTARTALAVEQPVAAQPVSVAVDIRTVSHQFKLSGSTLPVLDTIDFSVAAGEFVTLLGPSGCGKSTLLRLVAGLEKPTSGSILVDGQMIARPDPSRILVFQDPTLFPWATVWKNVATGLEARGVLKQERARVDSALALVELSAFADAYPHQLSGGMAQRASLARALVNDPALLLLDEPLGKLELADSTYAAGRTGSVVATQWLYSAPCHPRRRRGFTAFVPYHRFQRPARTDQGRISIRQAISASSRRSGSGDLEEKHPRHARAFDVRQR